MNHDDGLTPEGEVAVRHAGDVWREHGCFVPSRGPLRRTVRSALMEARMLGASWRQLGDELGIEPAALREQAGCMPRYGERPDPEHRRHGRGGGKNPCHDEHGGGCGERGPAHGGGQCGEGRKRRRRERGRSILGQ